LAIFNFYTARGLIISVYRHTTRMSWWYDDDKCSLTTKSMSAVSDRMVCCC